MTWVNTGGAISGGGVTNSPYASEAEVQALKTDGLAGGTIQVTATGSTTARSLADIIQPMVLPVSFDIVIAGDSIAAATPGTRWSDLIPNLSQFKGRVVNNTNTAVGGRTTADLVTNYAAEVYPLRPAVVGRPVYLFVQVGANDVSGGAPAPAATTFTALSGYWATAKADGFTVVAFTVMHRGNANTNVLETLDSLIRASTGWDYLVDAAQVLTDPYDTRFFQSDVTHPVAAGHTLLAAYINSIFGGRTVPAATFDGRRASLSYSCDFSGLGLATGSYNTACGIDAAIAVTTGTDNVAVGATALNTESTGAYNTAVGSTALKLLSGGSYNVAVGAKAGASATSSSSNTSVGYSAGGSGTTGANNVSVGMGAAYTGVGAGLNVAVGSQALYYNSAGNSNVAVGYGAGRYQADGTTALAPGNGNVYIGASARGFSNSDTNALVIGNSAIGEGANTTVIGSSTTTKTHVYGVLQIGAAGSPTISFGAAAPTTGTWIQGSVVFNSGATVGQPKGWQCTVAGTPGTWVSMGSL